MNTRIHQFPDMKTFQRKDQTRFAEEMFRMLAEIGADGDGISRETYGPTEQAAVEYCAAVAEAEGLQVTTDAAANMIIELPGEDAEAPCIVVGSHLDSVPQGGNYDGAAGVLAGLLSVVRMKRAGTTPPRTIRVMALRGEESAWFGLCYLGSSALFGQLAADDLERPHRSKDKTLGACMAEVGADIERIAAGERLIDPTEIAAYLELHIEQGPVMLARDLPVAVVTGLRGNIRHMNIVCHGEAGHAGAVPRWLRHDAVLATAALLARFDEHWRVLLERGMDLVLTAGILSTNQADHAMSRIPGECSFSMEVRSQSIDTLETFYQLMRSEADSVARERGVKFEFGRRSLSKPAVMNQGWVDRLLECCKAHDLPAEAIPSGAGHDAAVFANAGIPTAMIFVRNAHGSHNPNESMEIEDFMHGVDVLHDALLNPPL